MRIIPFLTMKVKKKEIKNEIKSDKRIDHSYTHYNYFHDVFPCGQKPV